MTPEEFRKLIQRKKKQLDNLCSRKMPVLAGNMAKRHIEADFRKGGFTNNGFHRWKETKRQHGGGGAAAKYGPLLSGRNHLSSSIQYTPGNGYVTVFTRVPYAAIHNRGGTVTPSVTPKMRRFAWAKHYQEAGSDPKKDTSWKRLALTKKSKLTIRVPQRQFIGKQPGPELELEIEKKWVEEINKIIHS